jgi:hypothetical protein
LIVLDTNVVSEPLKSNRDSTVLAWLDRQSLETLYITSISLAELRYGVAVVPDGRRKERLSDAIENRVVALFGPRVLHFDTAAATAYAVVRARARSIGSPIGVADAYIAATVAAHGFTVATRDTAPFKVAGVPVVNPWLAGK